MTRFCRNLFRSIRLENKILFPLGFHEPPVPEKELEVFFVFRTDKKIPSGDGVLDGRKGFLFSGGQSQTAKRILIRRIEILFEPVRSTMDID